MPCFILPGATLWLCCCLSVNQSGMAAGRVYPQRPMAETMMQPMVGCLPTPTVVHTPHSSYPSSVLPANVPCFGGSPVILVSNLNESVTAVPQRAADLTQDMDLLFINDIILFLCINFHHYYYFINFLHYFLIFLF